MVRIVKHITEDGKVDFEFVGFELWEDFDTLINILKTQMHAIIVDKIEGIYSRYWTFEIDNIPFKLMYHEDMGNCLCPVKDSGDEIIFLGNLAYKMLPFISESL